MTDREPGVGAGATLTADLQGSPAEDPRFANDGLIWVNLSDGMIVGDPRNPRDNEGSIPAIAGSIKRFTFGAPVVARPDPNRPGGLVIIAGHTRLAAAVAAGVDRVPVRVLDIDEAEGRALMLADNRLAEFATWKSDDLADLLGDLRDDGADLDGLGWNEEEIADLLGEAGGGGGAGGPPAMLDPPARPVSKVGEVYLLGRRANGAPLHALVCGDSLHGPPDPDNADGPPGLNGAQVALAALGFEGADLTFCDPPYAIYGSSTGVSSSIADDAMVQPFFRELLRGLSGIVPLFGQVYVCCDWRSWPALHAATRGVRLAPKNLLVWDKGGAGLGNNWANTYELVAYFVHLPSKKTMTCHDDRGIPPVLASNVIRVPRPAGEERHHNAAKPVELIRQVISRSKDGRVKLAERTGDHDRARIRVVLDGFAGSGSTVFAAHAEDVACALVEKEPGWCDVIRRRWTAFAEAEGIDPGPGALAAEQGEARGVDGIGSSGAATAGTGGDVGGR
jgi:hypothetical protein